MGTVRRLAILLLLASLIAACGGDDQASSSSSTRARTSILLVTLDTTRFDAVGPDAAGVRTPAYDSLVARGRRFMQAYATVPETLPSHASMMTGLYPAGHSVHENARFLADVHPLVAERLKQAGYRTAAFVSSFVLAQRFGLARGFDVYDDHFAGEAVERSAADTGERAIAYLSQGGSGPILLWVHFFDPHTPYDPPSRFHERHRAKPYLGEVAAMDEQLGRVVAAFEQAAASIGTAAAIAVVSDHGEGLGDHGELQHGNLLYQSTMHVPLVLVGPGVGAGAIAEPVSTRRIFHTLLDWAGLAANGSLRGNPKEIVLAEAMKPYLSYGWQPQIMAVEGHLKAILAGRTEAFDLQADLAEARDLGSRAPLSPALRKALDDYPVPSPGAAHPQQALTDEARRSLASLGYVSGTATPVVRKDAPRPADMVGLFETIDRASTLFVNERYAEVIPLLKTILAKDPNNLDAVLRLATSHSMMRQDGPALAAFRRAATIAPKSTDVRLYLALHYVRRDEWRQALPMLEQIVADTPDRVAALEGLALARDRQGRLEGAIRLRQRILLLPPRPVADLVDLGRIAMAAEQTRVAIGAFEQARELQGAAFEHDLEIGVLYLAERRLVEARDAFDRVRPSHPEYPMALFKRAQVSVLLNEPDRAARIERARQRADGTTRELIAKERLFQAIR